MPLQLPALCVIATPGNRRAMIDTAREAERRGFQGIYVPSRFSNMSVCEALAWNTERITFGTAIAPIYARSVSDFAEATAFIHEISGGRFRFGIGVAHAPGHARMEAKAGKPLADTRAFVEKLRSQDGQGPLPPIVIAALRQKMVTLAGAIGDGVVFANACRSAMGASLSHLPAAKRDGAGFFIGNMIPTCISDDIEAAKAVNRRTLTGYLQLPNYRNYWKECGYVEEMAAVERAIAEQRIQDLPRLMSDKWLADVTLFGPPARVREELASWYAAGVRTPIIVASSATGRQRQAIEEVFATLAG
ncbi:LLM class flavin-dependent oxidoreductase [Vineibacter terrae]|uniref:LLM class flavin-dependent oxidoreductase n=1 Tax=Vineibacter terrae TaxID=2586908 RepID=UPI002E360B00|nr:LLM class flavin-dependent oxidoreductase [Vineibacter terrae]HEX2888546.1 LLM class flavin-dependent oxidoreductase [Vineibacter terrae]